jgi:hypothetical protein
LLKKIKFDLLLADLALQLGNAPVRLSPGRPLHRAANFARRRHSMQIAPNCAVDQDRAEPQDRPKGSDRARCTNPCWKTAARALTRGPSPPQASD